MLRSAIVGCEVLTRCLIVVTLANPPTINNRPEFLAWPIYRYWPSRIGTALGREASGRRLSNEVAAPSALAVSAIRITQRCPRPRCFFQRPDAYFSHFCNKHKHILLSESSCEKFARLIVVVYEIWKCWRLFWNGNFIAFVSFRSLIYLLTFPCTTTTLYIFMFVKVKRCFSFFFLQNLYFLICVFY